MSINPVIKNQWVEALRSGKYEQGRGNLRRGNKYCCLGVLCELLQLKKIQQNDFSCDLEGPIYAYGSRDWTGTLPDEVRDEIGLTWRAEDDLIALNDAQRYTFDQIATYIEENL